MSHCRYIENICTRFVKCNETLPGRANNVGSLLLVPANIKRELHYMVQKEKMCLLNRGLRNSEEPDHPLKSIFIASIINNAIF